MLNMFHCARHMEENIKLVILVQLIRRIIHEANNGELWKIKSNHVYWSSEQ